MIDPIPTPTTLACATCGKPLSALTCYSVSVPLDGPVQPVDVCDLDCLAAWVDDLEWSAAKGRRQ